MSKNKKSAPVVADAATGIESQEKLDRIRDIVFGTQMRDYAQKFDDS